MVGCGDLVHLHARQGQLADVAAGAERVSRALHHQDRHPSGGKLSCPAGHTRRLAIGFGGHSTAGSGGGSGAGSG